MSEKKRFSLNRVDKIFLILVIIFVIFAGIVTMIVNKNEEENEKRLNEEWRVESAKQEILDEARYKGFIASISDIHCSFKSSMRMEQLPEGPMRDHLLSLGLNAIEPVYDIFVELASASRQFNIIFKLRSKMHQVESQPYAKEGNMTDEAIKELEKYANECFSVEYSKSAQAASAEKLAAEKSEPPLLEVEPPVLDVK